MISEELIGDWTPPPEGGGLPVPYSKFFENLRINLKRDLPNLNQQQENDKIMIMVCGGPTAKQFIEEIREKSKDDKYVIVCSNKTHDWLVSEGIIPDIFFMIDPKESKIYDVKNPQKKTKYYLGCQCNPKVFDQLKDYDVERVVVYCNIHEFEEEPHPEYGLGISDIVMTDAFLGRGTFFPLDGGTMAGLRAMTLGNLLGFKTVEFYGFDSCFFENDENGNPIYYSYKKNRNENILECEADDGRVFLSTPVFASQARQFIKWKHKLEWMNFIIHGDSFTAHLDKLDDELCKPKHDLLITPYMKEIVSQYHKERETFGTAFGMEHVGPICALAGQLLKKYDTLTILDYGCGKGLFKANFPSIKGVEVLNYDPCVEEFSQPPEPADIVICTDVMEHIEPDCLDNVLNDIQRLTKKACYMQIALAEAQNTYSDGRNTHLLVKEPIWWLPKLKKRFNLRESRTMRDIRHNHLVCMMQAKEIK